MTSHPSALSTQAAAIPDAGLREILKHCSLPTYDAARAFRQTGNPRYLRPMLLGILERHTDRDLRTRLREGGEDLRLAEDLGIDSLGLIEIANLTEDAVGFRVESEELRQVRTLGDLERFLATRARWDVCRRPEVDGHHDAPTGP
jgi:3-hydroxyacyl-[acyl-carrier-protein] dehydratase